VPLLKARCARCYTDGKYRGSLSLDTREDFKGRPVKALFAREVG
jgi:hypothetical protein